MTEKEAENKRATLFRSVNKSRAMCLLVALALEAIEESPPEGEARRMVLYEGMRLILETVSGNLEEVASSLND